MINQLHFYFETSCHFNNKQTHIHTHTTISLKFKVVVKAKKDNGYPSLNLNILKNGYSRVGFQGYFYRDERKGVEGTKDKEILAKVKTFHS